MEPSVARIAGVDRRARGEVEKALEYAASLRKQRQELVSGIRAGSDKEATAEIEKEVARIAEETDKNIESARISAAAKTAALSEFASREGGRIADGIVSRITGRSD